MFRFLLFLLVPVFLFSQSILKFQNQGMDIKVEKLTSNLGVVWGMSFISKDKLVFTIKSGEIGLLDLSTNEIKYFQNTPDVLYNGQGGLMDVQSSPNFKEDKTLYFTYVKELRGEGVTTLASAQLLNNELENWKDILVAKSATSTTRHFGSRITFDNQGYIFFSLGDRGERPNSQNLSNHAGTIIRLNLDGTIPKDNPFVNEKNKLPEIYSYGHRNPQGLFYDEQTKSLWSIEHGPRGGDEINYIIKGANYGWPIISYGKEYWAPLSVGEGTYKEGMMQPAKYYVPSIAPSSLIVYRGISFPKWDGSILSGALKSRHLNIVKFDKNNKEIREDRVLEELGERIRNVIQSPRGNIFISTDSGAIYKLSPNN